MTFSVPGNVLLLGEYAVLEENGLGVAFAVERRARAALAPDTALRITGTWRGATLTWTPERADASPLLTACVGVVAEWLQSEQGRPLPSGVSITVDSSDFYDSDGRKTGFGSSAAVTVAVVVALLTAAGLRSDESIAAAQPLAIAAHRRAQAGVGSGYDVTASLRGGMGLFRGGIRPTWEPVALQWNPAFLFFPGSRAVVTASSVKLYHGWKERNPGPARDFLNESNAAVSAFLGARTAGAAAPWLDRCRSIGCAIAEAIGVPAVVAPPVGLDPRWCKALGAGNEMGVCVVPAGDELAESAPPWQRVEVAAEGVRWEE